MYTYALVAKEVEPRRLQLAQAQTALEATKMVLEMAQKRLEAVNAKVAQLEADLQTSKDKKDELARNLEQCSGRLERADVLISGLAGERVRWQKTVKRLQVDYTRLMGDVLVAAGTIAYAVPTSKTPLIQSALQHASLEKVRAELWPCDASERSVDHCQRRAPISPQ